MLLLYDVSSYMFVNSTVQTSWLAPYVSVLSQLVSLSLQALFLLVLSSSLDVDLTVPLSAAVFTLLCLLGKVGRKSSSLSSSSTTTSSVHIVHLKIDVLPLSSLIHYLSPSGYVSECCGAVVTRE